MKLDLFDYRLIQLFKSGLPYNEGDLIKIWAKRCDLRTDSYSKQVFIHIINEHLLNLAHKLNFFQSNYRFINFICSLAPNQNMNYSFVSSNVWSKITDFDLILLSRLDSLFGNALPSELPGYKEFIDAKKL